MKLLLLADIHNRQDWLAWASKQNADLTAAAGDLLNAFCENGLLPQMVETKKWADSFPTPLAISSGNHDGNIEGGQKAIDPLVLLEYPEAHALLTPENWMDALGRQGVVTDRRTEILETPAGKIIVTTIPFYPGPQGPKICNQLWDRGGELKKSSGLPWIVLNHEPPAETAIGGHWGDTSLYWKIQDSPPDFIACGHMHAQPYMGDFADRLGPTWCFNTGAPETEHQRIPNHLLVETDKGTATWHKNPQTGTGKPEKIVKKIS